MTDKGINWNFCPGCGVKLPDRENLKHCTNCGIDLQYIKEHNELPPDQVSSSYTQTKVQTSYAAPHTSYKGTREVLSDEEILNTKEKRLWGNLASIGWPLLGFVITNGIILGIVIIIILAFPISQARNIIMNPIFMVFATLATYALFILPVWLVKKYLQNPSLGNRLTLLGFTTKGYTHKMILKEILIGIGFAFIGFLLVQISAIGIQLLLEFIFNVRFVNEPSGNAEVLVSGMDVLVLILMIIMMLLVVGPSEEIMFRGYMQRGLVRNLGEKWGILITAIIFASLHLVGLIIFIFEPFILMILFFLMFVPFITISLMIGLMYRWRKENLIAVVVTHGVYNSITLIIVFLYFFYS